MLPPWIAVSSPAEADPTIMIIIPIAQKARALDIFVSLEWSPSGVWDSGPVKSSLWGFPHLQLGCSGFFGAVDSEIPAKRRTLADGQMER